jgi:hypothetical protein
MPEHLINTTGRIVEAELASRIAKAKQILNSNSYDTSEEVSSGNSFL